MKFPPSGEAAPEAGADRPTSKPGILETFLAQRNALLRMIGRIVRPYEIEDIVQETFIHSYAASRQQNIHNPQAFMFRTARNLALNCVNRAEQRLNTSIEELDEFDFATDTDLLERQHHSEAMFLDFCRAVSSLPVHCRRVFILKKVYGLSQKEIASFLGISSSTVEKHIARGMTVTAEYLKTAGYTDFARTRTPRAAHAFTKARKKDQAS
jgi:RNA polymerase sigma factor (sigma-70 family)